MAAPSEYGSTSSITLANCADEPIHIPGQIQPHGTLLAFDADSRLTSWAANAQQMLQISVAPTLGAALDTLLPSAEVSRLVTDCIADMGCGITAPMALAASFGGQRFDCIAHAYEGRVLLEFEVSEHDSDDVAQHVIRANQSYDRLKRLKTVEALLQMAVEQVRAMTGYDRVMAYRFRPDDSGEVVAEACAETLVPFLGQRYPASDIPAQARRLYIVNTVRLIADVGYQPVPLLGSAAAVALNMSHGVLRSVSPVHIEYLQNMGVGASMSISILVNGRLWGMLACHHIGPKQVPYAVRIACDVLAQVLAATAQGIELTASTALLDTSAKVSSQLMDTLLKGENLAEALERQAGDICNVFGAQAMALAQFGELKCFGDIPAPLAAAMIASLPQHSEKVVERSSAEDWPEALRPSLGKWVGLLGLGFNPLGNGWLVMLRSEQIEAVRWGGRPEKTVKVGPMGMRLTPRGSFDEWRETVRGQCEPWAPVTLHSATLMLAGLRHFNLFRQVENDRVRALLLAMLSHDLRDPLHAIQMAATLLQHDERQRVVGRRIESSSARIQRLITQLMDMTQLQGGAAIVLNSASFDLAALIADLVDESRTAHPNVEHKLLLPPSCIIEGDADRIAQVVTNLIGNALHHGASMRPITLTLAVNEGIATFDVQNESNPIAGDRVASLFDPFKERGENNARNPGGRGLGLYIVHQIVATHGGSIRYLHEAPHVIFRARLPLQPHSGL